MSKDDKQEKPIPISNSLENKTTNVKQDTVPNKQKHNISDEHYQKILSYLNQYYSKSFPKDQELVPLAVGIHNQIFVIEDLPFSNINIKRFLKKYTSTKEYRKNLLAGKDRFDLHGNPTSKILEEEVNPIKWHTIKAQKKIEKVKKANHDSLIKKAMENPIAARELLFEYLPSKYQELLDLSTLQIEKESFVEDNLKTKYSDIIYSAKTKNNNKISY